MNACYVTFQGGGVLSGGASSEGEAALVAAKRYIQNIYLPRGSALAPSIIRGASFAGPIHSKVSDLLSVVGLMLDDESSCLLPLNTALTTCHYPTSRNSCASLSSVAPDGRRTQRPFSVASL